MDYRNMQKVLSENIRKYIYIPTSEFQENDIIFQKGEDGDAMYEVVNGSVGIYIHYGEPNQLLLAVRHAGDFFGEIALLENRPRTATVVALQKTELRKINSAPGFLFYICLNPDKLEMIMTGMSDRFKTERKNYLNACEVLAQYKQTVEDNRMLSEELAANINRLVEEAEKQRRKKQ